MQEKNDLNKTHPRRVIFMYNVYTYIDNIHVMYK